MKHFKLITVMTVAAVVCAVSANAQNSDSVAVSIAPLHSIVSGVTKGVETANLIVDAGVSPHGLNLKPSQIRKMMKAKAVFYIGNDFELFLVKPLNSLPRGARKVAVADKSGVTLLRYEQQKTGGHSHGIYDMHIWLSPKNAEKIARAVAKEMSQVNPRNKNVYKKNAREIIKKLKKLDGKIRTELAGLGEIPYAVFHDSYQYFEREYGLRNVGSILANPEISPSVAEIKRIRSNIRKSAAACVFSEPQFRGNIVQTVTEGTDAKTGVLDPLGAGLQPGPELYFKMMENLASSIKKCLSS